MTLHTSSVQRSSPPVRLHSSHSIGVSPVAALTERPARGGARERHAAIHRFAPPVRRRGAQRFAQLLLRRVHYAALAVEMPAVLLAQRVQHRQRRIGSDLLENEI